MPICLWHFLIVDLLYFSQLSKFIKLMLCWSHVLLFHLFTAIHNVTIQTIFPSPLPIVCLMSTVHLVCPVPLTCHHYGGATPSSGSSVGLAGVRVREWSIDAPSWCCGFVREERGKDEETMRWREEPTPFYQRRETEALSQATGQFLLPFSHHFVRKYFSAMWGGRWSGRAGARQDPCRKGKSSVLLMETSGKAGVCTLCPFSQEAGVEGGEKALPGPSLQLPTSCSLLTPSLPSRSETLSFTKITEKERDGHNWSRLRKAWNQTCLATFLPLMSGLQVTSGNQDFHFRNSEDIIFHC